MMLCPQVTKFPFLYTKSSLINMCHIFLFKEEDVSIQMVRGSKVVNSDKFRGDIIVCKSNRKTGVIVTLRPELTEAITIEENVLI